MKRLPNFLLMMLTTVLLATFSTSCSSSEDTVEIDPSKPQTPISDDDWQTIPISGGTITKDSVITITFPSGTFSKDTKVAVTEVKKGETAGDYEVSKFYQITMPLKIDRAFTVKIKCAEKSNDILFVASTLGYRKSYCDYAVQTIGLDGTYANGEYTLTLPATNRKEDAGSSYITFGLAHRIEDTAKDRVSTRATEGTVGNVKWYYATTWNPSYWLTAAQEKELPSWKLKFNKYIAEAIQRIHNLGFRVPEREIPFYFINEAEDNEKSEKFYGAYTQTGWSKVWSWSSISLNMNQILKDPSDTTSMKQTVIHELLHYYQAEIGPDPSMTNTNEGTMISEAGSVWAEKFMDGGKLNNDFVLRFLPWYLGSFFNIEEAWAGDHSHNDLKDEKKVLEKHYQDHGYAMSTLFYYFTSPQSKKNGLAIDSTKIVEFYQLWDKYPGSGFDLIRQWLSDHRKSFFTDAGYGDYLMSLLSGELISYKKNPMINVNTISSTMGARYVQEIKSDGKIEDSFKCLTFGCYVGDYKLSSYKNKKGERSFKGKEIVIKQLKQDITTYVIIGKKNNLKRLSEKTSRGDSIVISGDDLDQFYNDANISLYTVSANCTDNTKEGLVSFEIRDAKEEEIPTDVKKVRIHYDIYTNMMSFGETSARSNYMEVTIDAKDLKVSKSGNALTISGGMTDEYQWGTVNFSFNVNYVSGSWAEMTDLKVTREGRTSKYELEASKLKFSGSSGFGYGWEATGDDINKFVHSYEDNGKVTSENIRREENKYNKVAIYIKY